MRWWWALLSVLASTHAQAEEARTETARQSEVLDAYGPPSLPGLSHGGWAFDFDYTFAGAEATDVVSYQPIPRGRAFAYAARWLIEGALVKRFWYMGATGQLAAAAVPSGTTPGSGGSDLLFGNPEIWGRGIWSSEVGLSAGGGLAFVLPVPRRYDELESEVVRVIRAVRPADYPHFQDLTVTARPSFDVRHVVSIVVLQMRQGLDFSLLLRDPGEREHRYDIAAHAFAYVGLTPFENFTAGVELGEVYQLTADVSSPTCPPPCDQHRIQVFISPSARVHLPPVSTGVSMIIPLSTPLRGEVASYLAGRVHLEVLF